MGQKRKKTLAIDFDGTLCQYQQFKDGVIWQEPNAGAVEVMQRLHEADWNLIIWSVRAREDWSDSLYQQNQISLWCEYHGIPFDEITAIKPIATAYIDDHAIRFTNWQDIKNYFL